MALLIGVAMVPRAIAQTQLTVDTIPATPSSFRSQTQGRKQFNELLRQGKELVDRGNFAQAIAVYQQAASLDQNNAELYGSMGYLHTRQGQFNEAAQQFQQALKLDPNNPEYYDGLGFSYANLGELSQATSAYSAAISLAPKSVKYRLALGVVLLRQGDYGRVRQTYDEIARLQPGNDEAAVMMGAALLQSGQFDQAITFNREAVKYYPHRSELYLQLGSAYLEQGNLAAARQILEPRLNTDWRSVALHLTWATLMEAEQNYPAALEAYKKALRNDPQAIAAKIGSGRMYLAINQPGEAIWIFRDLTREAPNNADFYYFLGEAYVVDKKENLAKTAFEKAQQLYQTQNNSEGQERVTARLAELES
ncbi:MAG: tetratricopeptide repeat protein [Synechocystis sp.]|nr:tetratricopeptide repeat protein [Synechocystis sp.]